MCSDVKLTVVVLVLGDQIRVILVGFHFGIEFMLRGALEGRVSAGTIISR